MNWFKSGDLLDRAFAVGIILKGLDGVLEVVGGVLLLIVNPTTIDRLPDLPDAFRVFDWAARTHGLRCRGGLAHVSEIWQAKGCPSAARCSQGAGTIAWQRRYVRRDPAGGKSAESLVKTPRFP
jgi:hypothetical protein